MDSKNYTEPEDGGRYGARPVNANDQKNGDDLRIESNVSVDDMRVESTVSVGDGDEEDDDEDE